MIGKKFGKPSQVQVRKFIPLADIQGYELDDLPEWSYGKGDLDMIQMLRQQGQHSANALSMEEMTEENMGAGQEMAEFETARSREEQILEQLQQLMAEQQRYSQDVLAREEQEGRAQDMLMQDMNLSKIGIPQPPQRRQSFSEAFAAARRAGQKVFTWRGKKFNTRLK